MSVSISIRCDGCDKVISNTMDDADEHKTLIKISNVADSAGTAISRDLCKHCTSRILDVADPLNWPRTSGGDR